MLSPAEATAKFALRGVVYDRRDESISVAVAQLPDDLEDHERWRLDVSSDEVSSERQRAALQRTALARGDRLAELREVLLGRQEPRFHESQCEPALDADLNEAQRQAVEFALSARDVALIHGPPGTGKTTTVVELIRRAARRGEKVLACGPSNMAVDNLFERLLAHGERVVRLGHPARVMPELRAHTLDLLVERHEDVRLARKLVKDALALFRRAAATTRARPEPGARREMRAEAKSLLADARGSNRRRSSRFSMRPIFSARPPPGSMANCWRRAVSIWRSSTRPARAPSRAVGFRCCEPIASCWLGRSLPVAADRAQRRGTAARVRRQPVRAACRALRPAGGASARRAVSHAPGDHGLFVM